MSDNDNTLALAQRHNTEVHQRVVQRMTDVRRLMADFRFWVYKLYDVHDDPSAIANGEVTQYSPRPGWTDEQCSTLMKTVEYPTSVEDMRAAIEAAKIEEQQTDNERTDVHAT